LRPRILQDRIRLGRERGKALFERIERAEKASLTDAARRLQGLSRVLDSVSHKSALERGFALVRGENGAVRRRAAALKPGEALTLSFADGEALAVAGEGGAVPQKASPQKKKPGVDQGSLF
jgi:exodeoxyribonuclease VII large subunit